VAVLRAQIPLLTFARSALGLNPYSWQARVLCAIENKFPVALATCNGAGKTSIILGSAVLWFLWHFPRGRCVITSGSWTQLTEQLFMGLREFSTKPPFRGWSFLDSEIRTPQGGFAVGLSVDDPQRIEGWHSKPGSPVMFVVDEAKSIRDAIFQGVAPVHYRLQDFREFDRSRSRPVLPMFHRRARSLVDDASTLNAVPPHYGHETRVGPQTITASIRSFTDRCTWPSSPMTHA